MTARNKNTPALRFRGFQEKWKTLKFPELILKSNQGVNTTTENVQYSDSGYVVIRSNNISENSIDLSDVRYVDEETFMKIKDPCKPRKGDILYCNIGSALGSSAIYNSNEKVVINWNVFRIQLDFRIADNLFLSQNLNRTRKNMRRFATESTMPFISSKAFNRIKFNIPSLPEQQKIASFLSAIDEKIRQLSRRKELLEQYKKGVMQQLFSGKLRFKDEKGKAYPKWEEKKLGDVADIRRGGSPRPISDPKWFDSNSKIGWVRISDVTKSNKYLNETVQYLSKEGIAKSRLVKKGNMIMSICATIGKPIYTKFEVCIHDGFVVFENLRADKEYLFYYLDKIQLGWYKYGQPGTQVNLNIEIVSNETMPYPCMEEQQKIASFLSSLDSKIESVSAQIERTQMFKKGLLQQMFV